MGSLSFVCASQCEVGRRSDNDDFVFVDADNGIYVVCDGASARIGGRTAAELVCQSVQQAIPDIVRQLEGGIDEATPQLAENVLQAAHRAILDEQQKDPELSGMTSTVAMVLHRGNDVLLSHVGDSRIYVYRDPELHLMTRDHSLENYLKQNPGAQPKAKLPGKTLVRAMGLNNAQLGAHHKRVTLAAGDALLVCTDGLSDAVAPWIMREIVAGLPGVPLEQLGQTLVRAALAHGTTDNVSVLLLKACEEGSSESASKPPPPGEASVKRLGWLAFLEGRARGWVTPLEKPTVVGADKGCAVVLQEQHVSTRHAEIVPGADGFELRDLGSTNGTYVNDIRVQQATLVDGDVIRFGKTPAVFKSHVLQ